MKLETIGSYKFSFADHHGPPKVNFWQDPMSPSKWKEEHVSLGCAVCYRLFNWLGSAFL
ncbi:hypothetical protein Gotri_002856 [Gossypium trilobum]|uniref:Uncharacterized protein n=1 Tax=Gossypium trilobum TaxID=34281 RepID=A0A7J9F9M9_9ROSI|nr:hypothetical protein [Gossypium trilobum]